MTLRRIFRNIGWKLLSLALAAGLWLAIVGEPEMASSVSVPIQYVHIPTDYEISSDIPERVHLEVQGPTIRVQRLNESGMAVVLDLSTVSQSGERTFTIDQRNLRLPSSVRLVRAVPSQLRIRFDRRASREVPVQVRFSGAPPDGYRLTRSEAHPGTLNVVGPEGRVRRIDFAETDAIDLGAVLGTSEFHVHAFVDDAHVRFEASPRVTVKVIVERIPRAKELPPRGKKTVRN
jgi:YbbR domain-containing protein